MRTKNGTIEQCLMPPLPIGVEGIKQSCCPRASVWVRFVTFICPEWRYLMKLIAIIHYQVHVTLTTLRRSLGQGSKVKVSQRWPQKSCELDNSWTTEGIHVPQLAHKLHWLCIFKVTDSEVKVTGNIFLKCGQKRRRHTDWRFAVDVCLVYFNHNYQLKYIIIS